MNFSSIYSNVKRYLPVSLVIYLVGGSFFGLVVRRIVFVLNKQVHNPTKVAVLAYGFMVSDQFADCQWARGRLSEMQKSTYIYPGDYYDKLINDTLYYKRLKAERHIP